MCAQNVDLMGEAVNENCNRCKLKYAKELSACGVMLPQATVRGQSRTGPGKEYCVWQIPAGQNRYRFETQKCDNVYPVGYLTVFGGASLQECENWLKRSGYKK
jgi:hypothetical protein